MQTETKQPLRKYIIGYHSDINVTEGLMQFQDKSDADFRAEEWVEVEATSLDEAFAKYEETFNKWQAEQQEKFKKVQTKTIEQQRTQGEWKLYYPPANKFSKLSDCFTICLNNDPIIIAQVPINDNELEESEANAAFICKAVNEYDALKEENKRLLKALIDCQYQLQTWAESDAWDNDDEKAYNSAAKVIKSAKQVLK